MKAFVDEVTELERRKITCQPIPSLWAALGARTGIAWQRMLVINGMTARAVGEGFVKTGEEVGALRDMIAPEILPAR